MIPGPDKVIECPKCKGLVRGFTLMSGNTGWARMWTDGKMIAPMLSQLPAVTKCKKCGHYFWASDAKEIGKIPLRRAEAEKIPSKWKAAGHIRELSETEYLEAIDIGIASTKEQELYLRICAWWAGNDSLRSQGQSSAYQTQTVPTRSSEATMNLERLLELFDIRNLDYS